MSRRPGLQLLLALSFTASLAGAQQDATKPIPDPQTFRDRALATLEKTAAQREQYLCSDTQTFQELDGKGRLRKTTVTTEEFFFVNGTTITRQTAKDGKPLDSSEVKKQDERVSREIAKALKRPHSDPHAEIGAGSFLREGRLVHPRRILVSGRPTIVFDLEDDPAHATGNFVQKVVSSMRGTISIDEDSGHVQDVNAVGTRDVKMGGGLVADVHKGFALHLVAEQHADGVWLLRDLYANGSARLGLLMNRGGNLHLQVTGCRLFHVSTDQHDRASE